MRMEEIWEKGEQAEQGKDRNVEPVKVDVPVVLDRQGAHGLEKVALGIVALLGGRLRFRGRGALRQPREAAGDELRRHRHGNGWCTYGLSIDFVVCLGRLVCNASSRLSSYLCRPPYGVDGRDAEGSARWLHETSLRIVTPVDRCSSAQATLATLVIVTFWPCFRLLSSWLACLACLESTPCVLLMMMLLLGMYVHM